MILHQMKGQVTVEFLVLTAGTIAVYAIILPSLLSSFTTASNSFNANYVNSIASQVSWKANEVNLLEAGSMLEMKVHSPLNFTLTFTNRKVITDFNYSTDEIPIVDGAVNLMQGANVFQFINTGENVEVHLK